MGELQRWDKEFKRDCNVDDFQEIKHYWWINCYKEIEDFVLREVKLNKNSKILEVGSGSGNSSLRLASLVGQVFLLDKSKYSLDCSKKLADYYGLDNVKMINGDIFRIPFDDEIFDLCWNVGLIEHFNFEQAQQCIEEMFRVTKNYGYVCVGVPNFRSLPIIKAKINSALSRFINIKGYKLDDEKKYTRSDIEKIFITAANKNRIKISKIVFDYSGSFLPVETPYHFFKLFNGLFSLFFRKSKFIIIGVVQIYR